MQPRDEPKAELKDLLKRKYATKDVDGEILDLFLGSMLRVNDFCSESYEEEVRIP